jgi:hypothetical protein
MPWHPAHPTSRPTTARIDHSACAVRLRQAGEMPSLAASVITSALQHRKLLESQPTIVRGCLERVDLLQVPSYVSDQIHAHG